MGAMRTGVRIFLAAAVVATLVGMSWVGGLYYWHFRV